MTETAQRAIPTKHDDSDELRFNLKFAGRLCLLIAKQVVTLVPQTFQTDEKSANGG